MPDLKSSAGAGLVLGLLVLLVTGLLATWLVGERRRRSPELDEDDRKHFRYQDLRRALVLFILTILSFVLIFGTRVPPRVGGRPSELFLGIWVGSIGLVMALLVISFIDWVATRFYAKRRRLELIEEGLSMIEEVKKNRRDRAETNGHI